MRATKLLCMQGSARDLGAVRGRMQLAQPELDILMSVSNQDKTADGLQVMGHRLAQEVVQYLQVGPCLYQLLYNSQSFQSAIYT